MIAEELKELDFSSGPKAVEDIERNVDEFAQLHGHLDDGRKELEEVSLLCELCYVILAHGALSNAVLIYTYGCILS